ncbi:MAG: DNA polymerase subunit beta [Desulfobacterales bacterium CG23_combo_of_CG06-09_8_20_14_all_51_8]|nr:MAG: DNA polymerase subunit beta [Desulfobacterales bacterium CG23_combo_of_CG06-09_8_20_14_all_51_8]
MRLTDSEIIIIKSSAKAFFGPNAKIFLFGSRVDDSRKGGDIDLYVETEKPTPLQDKISFITHLKLNLGDQKIDVVVNAPNKNDQKIFHDAKRTGIEL